MTRWVFALAIGFVALLAATYAKDSLLDPGPLTASHRALSNCSACHDGASETEFGWLHAVFAETDPKKNSEATCLKCHEVNAETAFNAHGLALDELEKRTADARNSVSVANAPMSLWVRNAVFPSEDIATSEIYCASCHKEHQGERWQLSELSDTQCQTCHERQFTSFHAGHPDDRTYPFGDPTRIKFDHIAHFEVEFEKAVKTGKTAPDTCAGCHVPGPGAVQMVVKPYEEMCASCHQGQIDGTDSAGEKGIVLFSVPGLDLATLSEKQAPIGEWPEYAENALTPMMRMFIAADAGGQDLLRRVDAIGNLLELDDPSDAEVKTLTELVWKIKELVYGFSKVKMSESGILQNFMKRYMGEAGADDKEQQDRNIAALLASIPRDVWEGAKNDWFKKLDDEMKLRSEGRPVPMPGNEKPEPGTAPQNSETGENTPAEPDKGDAPSGNAITLDDDTTQDDAISLDGDAPADDAISLDSDTSSDDAISLDGDAPADDAISLDSDTPSDDAISLDGDAPADDAISLDSDTPSDDAISLDGDAPSDDAISLDGDAPSDDAISLDSDTSSDDAISLDGDAPSDDAISLDSDTPSDNAISLDSDTSSDNAISLDDNAITLDGNDNQEATDPSGNTAEPAMTELQSITSEEWAEFGGWYRDKDFFRISYRPVDHKDGFMRAWFDFARSHLDDANVAELFAKMSPKGPGSCAKCHSVDTAAVQAPANDWAPKNLDDTKGEFTRFSHEPHFSFIGDQGCQRCHALKTKAELPQSVANTDTGEQPFVPNFKPVKQDFCRECHNNVVAADDCQLCHLYHVSPVLSRNMAETTGLEAVCDDTVASCLPGAPAKAQ